MFFFRDAARRFRSLRDGFVLRGLGNKKRECEKECEREKERETASIDVFSRQIVYQQKKREREREREREKHPLI